MNENQSYCADCPDPESCWSGYPCDFVKTVNNCLEGTTTMSNTPNRRTNIHTTSTEGEDVTTTVETEGDVKKIKVSGDNAKTPTVEVETEDGIGVKTADHYTIRIPKPSVFFKNRKNVAIGLGSVVVIAAAAIVKFTQTHKVTVDVVKTDDPFVEVPEDDFSI